MVFRHDFSNDLGTNQSKHAGQTDATVHINAAGQDHIDLPDTSFVKDANLTRDGMDLILEGPDGTVVVEGYFAAEPAPNLVAPGGETLTANLVDAFTCSPMQYASNGGMTDESPVGAVQEMSGEATVVRLDGTVETLTIGSPIFNGDVVETGADGAVNIVFADETSFAVSEDARLAIDEYVFDPATQSGTTNFSVLKGMFVFTSGLIGRDDPDDVSIDTPVGSIGIRGTIIAGDVDNGEITVVEGAIVLRDFSGNEMTLATQFETAKFNLDSGNIDNMGQLSASDMTGKFQNVSHVSPDLFSSIQDISHDNTEGGANEGVSATDNPDSIDSVSNDAQSIEGTAPADNLGPAPQAATPPQVLQPPSQAEPLSTVRDTFLNTGESNVQPQGILHAEVIPPFQPFQNTQGLPTGNVPLHRAYAPDTVFGGAADGLTWQYHFDKEFYDPDAGDVLSFQLSSTTSDSLLGLVDNLILQSWNFDGSNGQLTLNFSEGFGGHSGQHNINIEIRAYDDSGNATDFQSYTVTAYEDTADIAATGAVTDSNQVFIADVTDNSLSIQGNSNRVYLDDNYDNVVTVNGGDGNIVYLGDGGHNVAIQNANGGSENNTVIGGFGDDHVLIQDIPNVVHGMDGNDVFKMNLSNTTMMSELQDGTDRGFRINGGHDFADSTNGYGDILQFNDAGNIDFTAIYDGYIQNIETINTDDSGTANLVKLSYTDVIQMTDNTNKLILNMDSSDQLQFIGGSNMTKANDTESVGGETYEVYTDGNVTLLVDVDVAAANITGLPA